MRSLTAIAGWVAEVPAEVLTQFSSRPGAVFPSKTTLWRVLTGADAAAVDAAVGAWLVQRAAQRAAHTAGSAPAAAGGHTITPVPGSGLVTIAANGKTVRGAIDADGQQVHLLAAATHTDSLVLGQVEVGAKTNEIPMFAPLPHSLSAAKLDLGGVVITADALHTQRSHAEYLHSAGAEFVLTAKLNQPRLFATLDALPWASTPIAAREVDTNHGRVTTHTIQVLPAPADLPSPHAKQV